MPLSSNVSAWQWRIDVDTSANLSVSGLAVYLLLWPDDGVMRKEDIRRIFDGSIFQHKANEYAEKQRRKKTGKQNLSIKCT